MDDRITGRQWSTGDRHKWDVLSGVPASHRVDIGHTIPAVRVVDTRTKAIAALERLEATKRPVAVDTEHDPQRRISVWSVSDGQRRWTILAKYLKHFRVWLESDKPKVMHFAAHDIGVFKVNGITLGGYHADTMVLDWMVDENRKRHGLKACSQDWLGIPMAGFLETFSTLNERGKPRVMTMREIMAERRDIFFDYASLDAYVTYWLYRHHKTVLQRLEISDNRTLWDYYEDVERDFALVVGAMNDIGMRVDVDVLFDIGAKLNQTVTRCAHVFAALAPAIEVWRKKAGVPCSQTLEGCQIKLRSPQQLAALFYDRLRRKTVRFDRKGKLDIKCRSTDREHLEAWAEKQNCVLAQTLLEHRRADKMRSTFIGSVRGKGLLSHVRRHVDASGTYYRVRTSLRHTATTTGRLSSNDPNLQNIPARKEKDPYRMRRAFVARKGCKLVVADYSGAELRLMAHFSGDKAMLKAFRNNLDLHSVTAKNVFNLSCPLDEVKDRYPDERNKSKQIGFGLQYGMKASLLGKTMGVSKSEAQDYIDAYFQQYSGVYFWMRATVEACKRRGYVKTLLGRRRYVRDIRADPETDYGKYSHAENQAMNAPIQGSVADIMKLAMNQVHLDPWMHEHDARLLLQVHDELIVECPSLDAYLVKDRLVDIMENVVELKVPLPVDAAIGDDWENAKA